MCVSLCEKGWGGLEFGECGCRRAMEGSWWSGFWGLGGGEGGKLLGVLSMDVLVERQGLSAKDAVDAAGMITGFLGIRRVCVS